MNSSELQLTDELRDQGLEAMTVLVMAKNRKTADFASLMTLHATDGTLSSGFQPARMLLLDALSRNPKAWAAFLGHEDHRSAAQSMHTAITDDIRSALADFPDTHLLLAVVDAQASAVAETRSLSERFAKEAHSQLDLREVRAAS